MADVTLRERVIGTVAEALMNVFDMDEIVVTDEGLLVQVDDEHFVVKTIQKKAPVPQEKVRGLIVRGEADTLFNEDELDEDEDETEMADVVNE